VRTKLIVVYSGGLDSTILLGSAARIQEVKAISFNYGQRHKRELESASAIVQVLGVEHRIVDLSNLRPLIDSSSQTNPAIPVPHGHYADENMKVTVVPNRNAIMLSIACAWAINLKYDAVAYAAHSGDHTIYPDCREEFITPFAEAMAKADWHSVCLVRPLLRWTKAQIVRMGAKLGLESIMSMSYSCYEGGLLHCGQCGTCQERRAAFRDAGVRDLTTYDPAGIAALPIDQLRS